jgi:hypothetical protein
MSTSADDHTEKGVEMVELQLDDDCASENSFGSSFGDNEMDEENMTADIELDPVYSDEEYPQSDNMYERRLSEDLALAPPTRSSQPAFNEKSSGPLMCVVRGLIFQLSIDVDQLL